MPDPTFLLALPLVLPLAAIALILGFRQIGERGRLAVMVVTCAAMTVVSILLVAQVSRNGILALSAGDWPAPFGIVLVGDLFSAVMVLVTAVIGLAGGIYAIGYGTQKFRGYFSSLYLALLMGVNGSFLTGDLFNMFVWFEVMLMSSFVLVALPGGRAQLEAGVKYLALNFISSAFFLVGLGVLYGVAGTLNMADLAVKFGAVEDSTLMASSAVLFLIAFGIKAGIFPFYFWLPASYHVTPTPLAAVFAGLLTKVGVYACVRVFTLVYAGYQDFLGDILLVLGVLTMITGVFGAATQFFIPRILSFHIISQIGYMIIGLAFFTKASIAATIFYVVHHILVKANLFLVGGIIGRKLGTQHLGRTGGLYRTAPMLALLFLIPAMSLGGIPPLSGFFAKLALIREGLNLGYNWTVFVALAVGLLTLYSMIKIWNEAFWKDSPRGEATLNRPVPASMVLPAVVLAVGTVLMGLFPGVVYPYAERAAEQIVDPRDYINAVFDASNRDMPPAIPAALPLIDR